MKNIWIDIINPSHALFFSALYHDLSEFELDITVRDRAETIDLVRSFGINSKTIGVDYCSPTKKTLNMMYRTLELSARVPYFDCALSFENGMSVMVSKFRAKKAILFGDNDIEFLGPSLESNKLKAKIRSLETSIKSKADYIIVPEACSSTFRNRFGFNKIFTYDGFKEDIYLAEYSPDPNFMDKLPFDEFVVLRPEALGSFYLRDNKSIVPEILESFIRENINVVFLPREKDDYSYAEGFNVYIPEKALNGLDLCYYSKAVLTGSGTMAREAACMGVPSVSFFPGRNLLSVDQQLASSGKIFHSRNVNDILNYVLSKYSKCNSLNINRCKIIKKDVLSILNNLFNN